MITVKEGIADFLLDQEARLNSERTIKDYKEKLQLWANYAGPDTRLTSVTAKELRLYVLHIRSRNLSRESIRSYIRNLRIFWSFAAKEYKIDNPMDSIKEPVRRKDRQPAGVANYDFIKLFEATDDSPNGIRDRAILCLFADTGARLGAITSLTMDSIDLIRRIGTVTEKGGVYHTIFWTHYTNSLLDQWLKVRPLTDERALFVSLREGRKVKALTRSGIYQVFKRLRLKAGVSGRCNPHSFRHNFARQYLLSGGDVVTLARILNHKDVNMTAQYYAIFDNNELSRLHNEHSPLLKMLDYKKG